MAPKQQQMSYANLLVTNLHLGFRDEHLETAFKDFKPLSAKVMLDAATGKSKRFGFVQFDSEEVGKSAMEGMDRQVVRSDGMSSKLKIFPSKHNAAEVIKPCEVVYVRNIPASVSRDAVNQMLESFGPIVRRNVKPDRNGPTWFVTVTYGAVEHAEAAVRGLHNKHLFRESKAPVMAKYADSDELRAHRRTAEHGGGPSVDTPTEREAPPNFAAAQPSAQANGARLPVGAGGPPPSQQRTHFDATVPQAAPPQMQQQRGAPPVQPGHPQVQPNLSSPVVPLPGQGRAVQQLYPQHIVQQQQQQQQPNGVRVISTAALHVAEQQQQRGGQANGYTAAPAGQPQIQIGGAGGGAPTVMQLPQPVLHVQLQQQHQQQQQQQLARQLQQQHQQVTIGQGTRPPLVGTPPAHHTPSPEPQQQLAPHSGLSSPNAGYQRPASNGSHGLRSPNPLPSPKHAETPPGPMVTMGFEEPSAAEVAAGEELEKSYASDVAHYGSGSTEGGANSSGYKYRRDPYNHRSGLRIELGN